MRTRSYAFKEMCGSVKLSQTFIVDPDSTFASLNIVVPHSLDWLEDWSHTFLLRSQVRDAKLTVRLHNQRPAVAHCIRYDASVTPVRVS